MKTGFVFSAASAALFLVVTNTMAQELIVPGREAFAATKATAAAPVPVAAERENWVERLGIEKRRYAPQPSDKVQRFTRPNPACVDGTKNRAEYPVVRRNIVYGPEAGVCPPDNIPTN